MTCRKQAGKVGNTHARRWGEGVCAREKVGTVFNGGLVSYWIRELFVANMTMVMTVVLWELDGDVGGAVTSRVIVIVVDNACERWCSWMRAEGLRGVVIGCVVQH